MKTNGGQEREMASNFEKMNYSYKPDKSKLDLRSDAQKASDYINFLAKEADAEQVKKVQEKYKPVKLLK